MLLSLSKSALSLLEMESRTPVTKSSRAWPSALVTLPSPLKSQLARPAGAVISTIWPSTVQVTLEDSKAV